ncbi:hypothetical protein [Demequina sp. NBRC 110057]|uniref:hypothetical protein n=1 Tax=Demequina sp. NBRC 110057 TaxID=1570346 RepID=UPI000A0640B4|nr:hypothetical protein [Demequina sp. NBRC 110057]
MGHGSKEMWGSATYLERDAGLPSMGESGLGPRPLTHADVDAIMACTDRAALAEMKGYARSYFAVGGSVIAGTVTCVAAALAGKPRLAIGAIIVAGAGGTVVMEARRRARQWEAAVDARLALLTG